MKYFISFEYENNNLIPTKTGIGNIGVEFPKLKSMQDIKDLEKAIQIKLGYTTVVITNYKNF